MQKDGIVILNPREMLPSTGGTYILLIPLAAPLTVQVGRLGRIDFAAGLYAYIGSAQGPGGLRARVGRHLRHDKPLRWHIDYLTTAAPAAEVWFDVSPARLECVWAQAFAALPGVRLPVPGFGASDCACSTHLLAFSSELRPTVYLALDRPRTLIVSP